MEPEIRFCTSVDDTRIAYATYSDAVARPAVVVNIFEAGQELWWKIPGDEALLEALSTGRMLVTFDRRGIGSSQREVDDLGVPAQVADLAAVVDDLGIERFDLVAFANGGGLAAAFAAEHPERIDHLLLWHPYVRTSDAWRGGVQGMVDIIEANWALARKSWASIACPSGPADHQRRFSIMLRDVVAPETAGGHFKAIDAFDARATLTRVKAPTLVLASSDVPKSDTASVRAIASLIPGARLATVEGDFGTLTAEPGQLATAILNFLGEADSDSEPELPEGMSAILFLDIADSTALTSKLGDTAYREKELALDSLLRTAITDAGGTPLEGKLLGDGILSVYVSAKQAIDAARRCRDIGNQAGLPLHLGIHAGDVIHEKNDVRGGAVQLASRIQSLAATGEILVSATVRDLARTSAGVAFEDRGEHELKGIDEPQRLFAVQEQ